MFAKFTSLLFVGVLAIVARADKPSAAAAASATDVIKASIKATGGEELLTKYKGGSMEMKGEASVQGINAEFDGKLVMMLPDKYRMEMTMSVMGIKIKVGQIMNGKKMKSTANGMDVPLEDNMQQEIRDNLAEHEVTMLVPLLDEKRFTLKNGDEAEVNKKKCDVVIVNSEVLKLKDVKMYFDKESHLLVKLEKKDKDDDDKEVLEEQYLEDYKKVDGIMTPHKYVVKHDGQEFMKFTVSDVKHLEKVDEKEFAIDD